MSGVYVRGQIAVMGNARSLSSQAAFSANTLDAQYTKGGTSDFTASSQAKLRPIGIRTPTYSQQWVAE